MGRRIRHWPAIQKYHQSFINDVISDALAVSLAIIEVFIDFVSFNNYCQADRLNHHDAVLILKHNSCVLHHVGSVHELSDASDLQHNHWSNL